MAIKRFKCEVIRRDEYIIEIDDEKIDEEYLKEFRDYMYPFHELWEHAEHLAQFQARFGYDSSTSFIEGYGHIRRDGKHQWVRDECKKDLHCDGINIIREEEVSDCEVEVEEIKEAEKAEV
jgi:hypothetical protein